MPCQWWDASVFLFQVVLRSYSDRNPAIGYIMFHAVAGMSGFALGVLLTCLHEEVFITKET